MTQHSSSEHVHVIAIITPAPGKLSRVKELLFQLIEKVKDGEPDVLKYEAFEQTNAQGDAVLVMEEIYKNQAIFDSHLKTDYFGEVGKTIAAESLLAAPLDIKTIKPIGGFLAR